MTRTARTTSILLVGLMVFGTLSAISAAGMPLGPGADYDPDLRVSSPGFPFPGLPYSREQGVITAPVLSLFADAGADQIAFAGIPVVFDGSGSFDEVAEIVDYEWSFIDSSPVVLSGVNPSYVFSTALNHPVQVTLTVTNSLGSESTDTMQVTVWRETVTVEKMTSSILGSIVVWQVAAPESGDWTLELENHGLVSMYMYAVDRGPLGASRLFTQTLKFSTQGAYPSGIAFGPEVRMSAGHYYQVTAVPFGSIGSYAVFRNMFVGDNLPPVAEFTYAVNGTDVSVDASSSIDPNGDPLSYVWDWGDGSKEIGMALSHTYAAREDYNITLTVQDPAGLESAKTVLLRLAMVERTFTIYDMFQQPWGEWYQWRYPAYKTDIILSDEPGNYTMIYNPDKRGNHGIIYAPYRFNLSARNVNTVSSENPEFMPALGPGGISGTSAQLGLYFEYLNDSWWADYWWPVWHDNPNWVGNTTMDVQHSDGWSLGVVIDAVMNRPSAEMWLGMPQADDPLAWWAANADQYLLAWSSWLMNEGNNRLNIWCGYEYPLIDMGTMMDLSVLPSGEIKLSIGHISWGYEVLMTRWLTETGLSVHEPNYEDFTLNVHYSDAPTTLALDAVCQYGLKAVKANMSVNSSAWAWEPRKIDYVPSWLTPDGTAPSEYDPWANVTYTSWNAGDPKMGEEVLYDNALSYFNLTESDTLIFNLPKHDSVIAYQGVKAPANAIANIVKYGDYGFYNNITWHTAMALGFYESGGPDLASMYDPVNRTLIMHGPLNFDNTHHPNGALYHGAPWIEFDMIPVAPVIPPMITLSKSVIPGGMKFTILNVSLQLAWGNVTISLGAENATIGWNEFTSADLTGTPPVIWHSASGKPLGALSVWLNITDLAGNGQVELGDYFTMTATNGGFAPGTTYTLWLMNRSTGSQMCVLQFTG